MTQQARVRIGLMGAGTMGRRHPEAPSMDPRACLGLRAPPVTVDDAFHSIAVLEAAYASIRSGGRFVRVPVE